MNLDIAIDLFRQAITHALMLAAPILVTTIVVGLIVSLVQAVTSIQEQTLSFAPKLFAVGGVMIVGSAWFMKTLIHFTNSVYQRIAEVAL